MINFISIFLATFVFFTFSKLFESTDAPLLQNYNNNYFAFSLIGIALADFTFAIAKSMNQEIRNGQLDGTFEELILTNSNLLVMLISTAAYPIVLGLVRMFLFFLICMIFFNLKIELGDDMVYLPIIFTLAIVSHLGVALISAAYTVLFKKGDPFNSLFFGLSAIFGGLIYPIQALPEVSIFISNILPITYILDSVRACLIGGNNIDLFTNIFFLAFISFSVICLGFLLCKSAIKRAKKTGNLTYY